MNFQQIWNYTRLTNVNNNDNLSLVSKSCTDHMYLANNKFMINEKSFVINDSVKYHFTTILSVLLKEHVNRNDK